MSLGYLINRTITAVGTAACDGAARCGWEALAAVLWRATQVLRRLVGFVVDQAMVAASFGHNVAMSAARKVGPRRWWGLPCRALRLVAFAAGAVSKVIANTPRGLTASGPFAVEYGIFNVLGCRTAAIAPGGANDPSITVTAERPLPIILVNGTGGVQSVNWSVGAPVLANAGYKVFTFNHGNTTTRPNFPVQATADIRESAHELSDQIDRALAETGASQVILIGHSQGGGILPHYYINTLGGAEKVAQLIGITPSNHGTTLSGVVTLLSAPVLGPWLTKRFNRIGAACLQQFSGSSLVRETYRGGDTRPGVIYDTISTANDWVVTPHIRQALHGPGATNIVVQEHHPGYLGGHVSAVVSYQVWQLVLARLAANPAANRVVGVRQGQTAA